MPTDTPTPTESWQPIAVDHVTRTVPSDAGPKDVAFTVVMMRDRVTGHLKSWETRGTFTLEQLQAQP